MESQISPLKFGSIRGAAAMQHLDPGATALSIPEHCLIHEGTAAASDIVCCWDPMHPAHNIIGNAAAMSVLRACNVVPVDAAWDLMRTCDRGRRWRLWASRESCC